MELFPVNRFTGLDENAITQDESELREKFFKKIEERKNNRQEVKEKEKIKLNYENSKKRKNSNNDDFSERYIALQNAHELKVKTKKLKKDKSHQEDTKHLSVPMKKTNYNGNSDDNDMLQESVTSSVSNNNKDDNLKQTHPHTAFTILKNIHPNKKEKVKRKLPIWLANPSVVSVDLSNLTSAVDSIPDLDQIFVDTLKSNNIFHFFPVQEQVIPWLLQSEKKPYMYWSNDICVSAPTGSGKTLAFVLPILQLLYKRIVPRIRALVVLPVQDLANQVYKVFKTFGEPTTLNILLLTKRRSFEEEQGLICENDGMGNYRSLVDIIVTTPGRLVEHLQKTKGFCLDELMYLVIDEADRIMENIQNDWLYHLNKHINSECTRSYQVPIITYNNLLNHKRPPNKLLFSATLSQDPEKLQQLGLFHPKLFTSIVKSENENLNDSKDETRFLGKYTTPAELKEYFNKCSKTNKPLMIHHLIKAKAWKNILCFVNSAKATSKLAYVLQTLSKKKVKIGQLSSDLSSSKRDLMLKKFSSGELDVLISSDALARGIDIPNVKYVISYDCPKYVKTYIHRIGRTARAGKQGISLILLTPKEVNHFQKMISTAGKKCVSDLELNEQKLQKYGAKYEKALNALANHIEKKEIESLEKIKAKKKLQTLAQRGKFKKILVKKKIKIKKKIN